MELFRNLQLFADAGTLVNTTTGTANAYSGATTTSTEMSVEMKTYYDTELLENARPRLIFSQLGKPQRLPKNHGRSIEFRRWKPFDKSLDPLVEGVIPTGKTFGAEAITAAILQYGDYTALSDVLEMHTIDNVILGATEEMGAAGGWTADTLVRDELLTGINVIYADTVDANGVPSSTPEYRYQLQSDNNRLTPDAINKAYTWLKKQKAPFYEGNKYVAVIHPSVAYDLRSNEYWVDVHKYSATREIFEGEIGELHGVRFIENTEAPVLTGGPLFGSTSDYLTVSAYSGSGSGTATAGVSTNYRITVSETLTAQDGIDLVGRKIHYWDYNKSGGAGLVGTGTIVGTAYSSKYLWVEAAPPVTLNDSSTTDKLYPGEGGDSTSGPCAVYPTFFFGKDAFAVIDPEGMGMEMIIKNRDQVGGPLNQFSTIGYKFEAATKILYENRMVRVECCSAYSTVDDAN